MPISGGGGIITITGDISTGLIHWWKLSDISAGNAPDSGSGPSNPGTANGSPGSQAGPNATYATVPSFVKTSSQDIAFSNITNFNWASGGSFTWAGWVYITDNTALSEDAVNNQQYFYDDRDGSSNFIRVFNANPGLVGFDCCGTRLASASNTVPSNTWTHLTCVNSGGGSGGTPSLYVNGSLVSGTQTSPGYTGFTVVVSHLAHGNALLTAGGLTGALASVRIYNRALTSADVSALFGAGG